MIELDISNEEYPEALRNISKPPKKLYTDGDVSLLKKFGIAVVGSRHHSEYGTNMCKLFVKELVQYDITIISGLALGIDSISHKTCIENGGKTIVVLPCGLDKVYPKQNKGLLKDIINLGGLVVTEYLPDVEATSEQFLARNRIVAGLAKGTLIVEAGYRSGTSVTARLTMEQNKNAFCIPSSLENRHGITCNKIIQEGGKLVTCAEDILQEFEDVKFVKKEKYQNLEFRISKEYIDVYRVLNNKPKHINEIVRELGSDIKEVNYKLMMLEIEGAITQLPGRNFIRK